MNPFKVEFRKTYGRYFFRNFLVSLIYTHGFYLIQLQISSIGVYRTVYRSRKRPLLRHLGLLSVILSPVALIAFILFAIACVFLGVIGIVVGPWASIASHPEYNHWTENVGAAIWFFLGLTGAYSVLSYLLL